MNLMFGRFVVILGLLLTVAQGPLTAEQGWLALGSVKPASQVTVVLKSGQAVTGRFRKASDSALTLVSRQQPIDLLRDDVLSVTLHRRKSMKAPVLIGAAIGAGGGAGLGAAAGGCQTSDFLCFERSITVPVGAGVGAVLGAISGLVVGLFRQEQVTLYLAPKN